MKATALFGSRGMRFLVALLALAMAGCRDDHDDSRASSDAEAARPPRSDDADSGPPETPAVRIRLTAEAAAWTATLEDSATARELLALLPMQLTLRDYAGTEKVGDLPRRLTTRGAPAGWDPDVGDITYYAPWGNVALFYRDFGYADGLVKLGRLVSGVEALARLQGEVAVRIELEEPQ